MNVFCIVLLALCPLSIGMNISVETALQDRLEDAENPDVFSRIWNANKHLLNRTDDKYVIQFIDIVIDTSKNFPYCKICLWPKSSDGQVYVPYILEDVYSKRHRSSINTALLEISTFSCIKFVRRINQQAYIKFIAGDGSCKSFVGRIGSMQLLWLSPNHCVYHHVIQHEMFHALAFFHEQTRSDRDDYIRIIKENIRNDSIKIFDKTETKTLGTPYEYTSVMHYSKTAFSKNGKPTMLAISDPNIEIGQRDSVTEIDLQKLNKLYNCEPECGKLMRTSTGTFTSPNYPKFYPSGAYCKWLIRVGRNQKILLEFTSYEIQPFLNCLGDHVTVHDGSDASAPKLFGPDCGAERPLLMSKIRQIFVVFRSKQSRAPGFSAKYKPIPNCGEMKKETTGDIRFQRPYSANHKELCTWVVLSPRAYMIVWMLTHLDIPSSENCTNAYVRVTDTAAPTSTVKGTYCGGQELPLSLHSYGRSLLVEYFHNAPGLQHGFRSTYKFIKNPNFPRFIKKRPNEGSHHNASGLLLCILLTYSLA